MPLWTIYISIFHQGFGIILLEWLFAKLTRFDV